MCPVIVRDKKFEVLFLNEWFPQVVKVWDLSEFNCLQTIPIKFPWLLNVKQPDYIQSAVVLHKHQTLVIGFGDYLAQLKVGKAEELDRSIVLTHNTQLCCAIYNSVFQQVCIVKQNNV